MLKLFFFVTNEFPAVITYYERLNPETYKKADIMENITDPKSAEEFISGNVDYDITFAMPYIADSVEKACRSVINESYPYYIKKATSDNYAPSSKA